MGISHLFPLGEESVLPLLTQESNSKSRRGILRRAVFSEDQRKALEKMFQKQKYISKTDRKKLALNLGLKESQVRNVLLGKSLWNGFEGRKLNSAGQPWALLPANTSVNQWKFKPGNTWTVSWFISCMYTSKNWSLHFSHKETWPLHFISNSPFFFFFAVWQRPLKDLG